MKLVQGKRLPCGVLALFVEFSAAVSWSAYKCDAILFGGECALLPSSLAIGKAGWYYLVSPSMLILTRSNE